ncbi:MAG: glycosyltransferase, partial [Ignavibacteriales bacterium]|nr:glycosyltransferase [Ignavibacteriales bacterium]
DIGVIPFRSNRITDVINPLKLYEYCAAGLPIVAMRTPELNHYSHILYLSDTHEEFLQNIEKPLREDSETKRKERILFARNNTWESRVEELLAAITRIQDAANDIMASDKAPRPSD